jgi:group I intron endonuclease
MILCYLFNMVADLAGVYLIRCVHDGRVYVGSSGRVRRRWGAHKSSLSRGVHHCRHLQRAWSKHGAGGFLFEIIELVDLEALRLQKETLHIQAFRSSVGVYNTAPVGGTIQGMKMPPRTAEHRRKIGDAHRGKVVGPEFREWSSKMHKGKTISPEHRAIMAASSAARVHTDQTRARLSAATARSWEQCQDKRIQAMRAAITPERRILMREAATNISEETRRKRAESVRLSWIVRRQQA